MTARSAYVPLSFAWGEAFQFDWSDEGLVIGGVWRKVQLAHMKLCASRAFWLVAYPSQGHEMLFDAHTRCLTGLGRRGRARHLRQHEDGGRPHAAQRSRPRRQRALCGDGGALPLRAGLLQCRVRLGEGPRREERAGHPPADLAGGRSTSASTALPTLNAWLATQCLAAWDAPHPELAGLTIREAWDAGARRS